MGFIGLLVFIVYFVVAECLCVGWDIASGEAIGWRERVDAWRGEDFFDVCCSCVEM